MYDKVSIGVIYPRSNELTIYSVDQKRNKLTLAGSFLYSQYDYELKKTSNHLLAVRTQFRNTITFYSIVDSEALIDNIKHKVSAFIRPK